MKYGPTWYVTTTLRGRELMTATEVHSHVKWNFDRMPSKPSITLATVSGILAKLVREGKALRVKGFGPRGGYGYVSSRLGRH